MKKISLLCLVSIFMASHSVFADAESYKKPSLGSNLNGVSYWSTELPFIDIFKTSGAWVSGTRENWNDGRRLDLDKHGWVRSLQPGQVALTVLFAGNMKFNGAVAGRYIVEYTGTGSLEYGEAARLVKQGEHRDIIEIDEGASNALMTLTSTDPENYIQNIRIIREEHLPHSSEIFNPIFLESLKGYDALRFMIWMLGESSEDIAAKTWDNRPTSQDARWTIKGVPVEIMVALANRVGADPWFTIPHAADDDYARNFAQRVSQLLNPDLKVYLEYSNEVWNDVYPQTAYAREKGLALGLSQEASEAVLRFYAKRATQIFEIWQQILSKNRLIRVLSFQSDIMPEYADEIALSFENTAKQVDALAIGPYFGTELGADIESVTRVNKMGLDEFIGELEESSLPKAKEQMSAHAAVARKYGLALIAYEGGQHLWNLTGQEDVRLNALFYRANRDARMGVLYSRYLKDWVEAGGGLFMHLLDCGDFENAGNWGAREYLTQPRSQAPKYDALQKFIED